MIEGTQDLAALSRETLNNEAMTCVSFGSIPEMNAKVVWRGARVGANNSDWAVCTNADIFGEARHLVPRITRLCETRSRHKKHDGNQHTRNCFHLKSDGQEKIGTEWKAVGSKSLSTSLGYLGS
ncbi:MAG TPA: hypothetical protein VIS99_10310 [Terrimicrobiaceae bacterium]